MLDQSALDRGTDSLARFWCSAASSPTSRSSSVDNTRKHAWQQGSAIPVQAALLAHFLVYDQSVGPLVCVLKDFICVLNDCAPSQHHPETKPLKPHYPSERTLSRPLPLPHGRERSQVTSTPFLVWILRHMLLETGKSQHAIIQAFRLREGTCCVGGALRRPDTPKHRSCLQQAVALRTATSQLDLRNDPWADMLCMRRMLAEGESVSRQHGSRCGRDLDLGHRACPRGGQDKPLMLKASASPIAREGSFR